MKPEEEKLLHRETTKVIIEAFYVVYNELGYGFLERVYENALSYELTKRGLSVQAQLPINVYYNGQLVGEYFADLVVDNKVIVELKAAESLSDGHKAQLLNYLKATDIEVGLLVNFGSEPQFIRRVFLNTRKKHHKSNLPAPSSATTR